MAVFVVAVGIASAAFFYFCVPEDSATDRSKIKWYQWFGSVRFYLVRIVCVCINVYLCFQKHRVRFDQSVLLNLSWLYFTLHQPTMHIYIMGSHKPIMIYMGGLILGINTLYRLFCFFKLFPMVGKGLNQTTKKINQNNICNWICKMDDLEQIAILGSCWDCWKSYLKRWETKQTNADDILLEIAQI